MDRIGILCRFFAACVIGIISCPASGGSTGADPTMFQSSCVSAISPTGRSHSGEAETGTISVRAPDSCAWSAISQVPWVTIISGGSGVGNGMVTYAVAALDTPCSRTGTLTIGGVKFEVSQLGPLGCILILSPTSSVHGPGTATGAINITQVHSSCSWDASTKDSWISIVAGATGSGNGTVYYQVSANDSTERRAGTIRIRCDDVTIVQEGRSAAMPTVSGVYPSTVTAGGGPFELTLTGANFLPGARVRWNGRDRPTTFLGVTQLRAAIEAADIAAAGTGEVTVVNPPGDTSDVAPVTIAPAANPSPSVAALSPSAWAKGGVGFLLTVQGSNFVPGSKVLWNGSERATTYESRALLSALILPTDVQTAGKWRITVTNPPPGGGESDPAVFEVIAGTCITEISPRLAALGGSDFKLSVFITSPIYSPIPSAGGSEQPSALKVLWNGQALATTWVNERQLSATVPATLVKSEGTATVAVAGADGGSSNSVPLPITLVRPVPLLSAVNPESAAPGTGRLTLTLEGKSFIRDSQVLWNGAARVTRFLDSTRLEVDIPSIDTSVPGASTLTVVTLPPGGGESNRHEFTFVKTLYFPCMANRKGNSGGNEYTGVAVGNLDASSATLTFTAYDAAGTPLSGTGVTNPVRMPAEAGRQLALVDHQIFGSALSDQESPGWFRMESSGYRVAGFFLMFDRDLTVLDGADVSGHVAKEWIIPEIEDHGFTRIHAANPGIQLARLMLELYGSDGKLRAPAAVRNLNPSGSLSAHVSDLFPAANALSADYVRVVSDRGVVAFEYLGRDGRYVEGLNGRDPVEGSTVLYSPQYVVGGKDWRTTLTLVNLSERNGTVTFRLIGEDGMQIGSTRALEIAARGKIHVSDQRFFLDAGSDVRQGYVEVTSDGIKLTGSTVFGDPGLDRFSSALPLVSALETDVLFSQLASDDIYFTGLAILNPGSSTVSAAIDVFDSSGRQLATRTESIGPRRRHSGVLTQWFPNLQGMKLAQGYVRVRTDSGAASFALFGTQSLTALSAVPAQPVR